MHVDIHTAALPDETQAISNSAAATVRMGFNPSGLEGVDALKALGAAFITLCDELELTSMSGSSEFTQARHQMQGACMWAVAAATKGR